jgi:ATP-dependent Clp protease ATP-binding subunit ClpC
VSKVEDQVRGEVKRAFNPEFLNRLDDIILFTSLTDEDLIQIMRLLVESINKNLETKQIKIRLSEDAAKYILEKTCADRSYGARPLRRALQKYIEDPLSEALIQGSLPRPSELDIYLGGTGIYYRVANQSPLNISVEEVPVAAGDLEAERPQSPGIPLYTF